MAVVQSAYLTRHVGGAVHMLVFAFIHGVTTSLVWRALCVCVCVCVNMYFPLCGIPMCLVSFEHGLQWCFPQSGAHAILGTRKISIVQKIAC